MGNAVVGASVGLLLGMPETVGRSVSSASNIRRPTVGSKVSSVGDVVGTSSAWWVGLKEGFEVLVSIGASAA